MFNRSLSALVIVMVIALVGITSIQFIWITNTWNESEKLLKNRIEQCLNDVDQQLNNLRKVQIISERIMGPELQSDSLQIDVSSEFHPFNLSDSNHMRIEIMSESQNFTYETNEENYFHISDTSALIQKHSVYTDEPANLQNVDVFIAQIIEEIDLLDPSKDARLDSVQISNAIALNFKNNDLTHDINWGIKDHESDSLMYSMNTDEFNFEKSLFANDILAPNRYSLMIYYPIGDLLWKKTGWMILLSFVFTLIILLVFILAVKQVRKHKKISEIKSDFLNNLTHELKTPLASISLASDTLAHESIIDNPTKVKEYAALIKQEKNKLTNHVERILELAALEKNKIQVYNEGISLNESVNNAIRDFELIAKEKAIKFQFEEEEDHLIKADPKFLPSVVGNIIDNAIKYSKDESVVEIRITKSNEQVHLVVKDHGIGMTKDQIKQSYDSFYRAESGNIHNTKGFGIGLSFVKQVMTLFDGEVSLDSTLGKGTTVTLKFQKA